MFLFGFGCGVVFGFAASVFWKDIKAWFSDEEAAIRKAVSPAI